MTDTPITPLPNGWQAREAAPVLSVKESLHRAARWLAERQCPTARLDAELLLGHILGMERLELYLSWDRPLSENEKADFRELLRRRGEHEPVAYIVGRKEFFGLPFQVTRDVLIPRPETELVVEKALEVLRLSRIQRILSPSPPAGMAAEDGTLRVADVGTGSGAIAVAFATETPSARVVATDISEAALAVARENAERHGVASRVDFRLCGFLDDIEGPFDMILSNPPYIALGERDVLPLSVSQYEPSAALFAGEDGLDAIRGLIDCAGIKLRPEGWLIMEIGAGQSKVVGELIFRNGHFCDPPEIVPDYQGIDRVVCARLLPARNEMSI